MLLVKNRNAGGRGTDAPGVRVPGALWKCIDILSEKAKKGLGLSVLRSRADNEPVRRECTGCAIVAI